VGKIVEYTGEGVKSLSVTDRATITNMGAELGATTSIFPSDENTLAYLISQGRPEDYIPLSADEDASYDERIIIDLSPCHQWLPNPTVRITLQRFQASAKSRWTKWPSAAAPILLIRI
jgi:aconitase A